MLEALTLIFSCQLLGESLVRLLDLPLPGPVAGMLILFAGLAIRGGIPSEVERAGATLLGHLPLLFVPAGVGVMVHWNLLREHWLALAVALLLGTLITLVVTALTMSGIQWLMRRLRGGDHS
ncbi:CidA/LrgA family protein [Imhoffiella purpurea]|uniref:Antiholin-like protein LrgA n=1 Tax=Imhoffiella purpurea TaxID=1249627 RepID=W9VLQ1_9GAMM|nr:CidA/LrgA family protein [Imhoffiella purpurea]EXJ17032.1 Antiholin-like protein LrgA [Imhoffiella purpurea]